VFLERSVDRWSRSRVLKVGGAYVPLDPEYPKERLALILRTAALR
jgi:non-ribosomal peptide synthetase component F